MVYIVWSSKLCATFLNIAKYFKTLRCGCGAVAFIFSIYLKLVLYVLIEIHWLTRNYVILFFIVYTHSIVGRTIVTSYNNPKCESRRANIDASLTLFIYMYKECV